MPTAPATPPVWAGRVEELLESKGKSRAWLAEEIGLSTGFLTQLMLGIRAGHPAQLRHIAAAFGVPVSWITLEKSPPSVLAEPPEETPA